MIDEENFDSAPESFETAHPVAVPRPAFELTSDPESYIISCCLLDEGKSFELAMEAGIRPQDFKDRRHQVIYGALKELENAEAPIALDTLVPQLNGRLESAGGIQYLLALTNWEAVGTTTRASYHINALAQAAAKAREIKRLKEQLQRVEERGVTVGPVQPKAAVRPITSYAYPSEDDPNTLLGNDDYLGRGGGLLFVSHAGAGKSSWIMDACMMWAIGRAWMGIKCNGALKSLIIQAEDSDRYIGKIFASFAHVNQLTPDQLALLTKNCIIVRLKGVSGAAFERVLAELVAEHTPDLVIINPVYLYADGDISRSEFAQPFLVGLDRVNKEEKFAYILIHHTGKPAKKDAKQKELDDWESAYMGFGSSYFANWPRCTALLEPTAGANGRFQIKLGKGGLNAGITRQVQQGAGTRQEPVTRIAIKHSTERMDVSGKSKPVYYWEMDSDAPEVAPTQSGPKSGRPQKYTFSQIADVFPAPNEPGRTFPVLLSYARSKIGIGETAMRNLVNDAVRDGQVRLSKVQGGYVHHLILPGA